jgi:very-short-patch-repair endonuclease
MTLAERKLWAALREKQILGHRFRRQHPIGPFIADFICLEAKLILEVDGSQHGEELNALKDRDRTIWLAKAGYRVLRFWNGDVLARRADVVDTIERALSEAVPPSGHARLKARASIFPLKGGS